MSGYKKFRPQRVNANKHTEIGLALLDKSIRGDGWIGAITVAADGETFDGSARLERVADIMGEADPIVLDIDGTRPVILRRTDIPDANDSRAKRLGVAANSIAAQDYNPDGAIMAMLAAEDEKIKAQIANDDKAIRAVLEAASDARGEADAEPQIDRAAELNEKWQVKTSDLWQIGEHRLLCGDSTRREDVERVMGGEKADMVFIDPPYGVDYEGGASNEKKREKLAGDVSGDLYAPILTACKDSCKPTAPMYVWFADRCGKPVYDAVHSIGYKVRAMIIWNKIDAHYGAFMAQYMQKHEPCLYIVNGNANFIGASNEVTVWDVKQPSRNEFHPTQKPVDLAIRAIGNHDANIVVDYCAGSGTTLVACQNLNRKCRAVEISTNYCAVILERMSEAFPALAIHRIEA